MIWSHVFTVYGAAEMLKSAGPTTPTAFVEFDLLEKTPVLVGEEPVGKAGIAVGVLGIAVGVAGLVAGAVVAAGTGLTVVEAVFEICKLVFNPKN